MSAILKIGGTTVEESNRQAEVLSVEDVTPGLFDGTGYVGNSLAMGANKLARGTALAGSVVPVAYDYLFDDEKQASDWYFKNVVDDPYQSAKEYYKINGKHMGAAGGVLNGLAEMLPQLIGGGASLTASTYMNAAADAVDMGVDSTTAQGVGALQGIAAGLGVWMPMVGKSVAGRVFGNAALNPVVGAVSRGATGALLDVAGYEEQAKQYDAFDMQTLAVESIAGAAFGGIASMRRGAGTFEGATGFKYERLPTQVKDAIATARSYLSRSNTTMPGKPVDLKSQMRHLDATDKAVDQLSRGEPVRVADIMEGTQFTPVETPAVQYDMPDDGFVGYDVGEALPDAPVIRQVESGTVESVVTSADPDIARSRQAILDHGDFEIEVERVADPITGEIRAVKRKASEVLDEAEIAYKQKADIAEAIKTAANCYLGSL